MKPLLIILLGLLPLVTSAQSLGPATLNATGKSATLSGNTYEYAIGGLTGNTYTSASLVVTPGVLQPVQVSTGIGTPEITTADLSVFPNPAAHTLYLQPHFGKKGTLQYVITDVLGRTIATQKINLEKGNEKQEIDMSPYAMGQYNLTVHWLQQGKTYRSTYKVQKIN